MPVPEVRAVAAGGANPKAPVKGSAKTLTEPPKKPQPVEQPTRAVKTVKPVKPAPKRPPKPSELEEEKKKEGKKNAEEKKKEGKKPQPKLCGGVKAPVPQGPKGEKPPCNEPFTPDTHKGPRNLDFLKKDEKPEEVKPEEPNGVTEEIDTDAKEEHEEVAEENSDN